MMFRPAVRFLIAPRPPDFLAARFFAAVILPPLLFFAILKSLLQKLSPSRMLEPVGTGDCTLGDALGRPRSIRAKNCVNVHKRTDTRLNEAQDSIANLSG